MSYEPVLNEEYKQILEKFLTRHPDATVISIWNTPKNIFIRLMRHAFTGHAYTETRYFRSAERNKTKNGILKLVDNMRH